MPKRLTVSATLLALTLLLAIANAGSAATSSGREAAARRAAQQPLAADAANDVFTINDGFVTKTYNHLGNPANGILTAETWGESGWIDDGGGGGVVPNNSQGVVRALKQSKVLRVAVRVELWGADGPGTERRLTSSSTVNSGTAASAQVATPEVDVRTAPCLLWTQAFVTIRWSDNRLSSLSFEMPVGYFNLDAHC
jgi:alkylhydroperoxidase family enzyme